MKQLIFVLCVGLFALRLSAGEKGTLLLPEPDLQRGLTIMKAFSLRASASDFDTTTLRLQDLSDLSWAANGINRKASGKRTAPSAMNGQDVDLYLVLPKATYCYNAALHQLDLIVEGDLRPFVADRQTGVEKAPVICLLISDISRFRSGDEAQRVMWAAEDAGIVSQNISLFCAVTGLITRPRATMNQQKLRDLLRLKETQRLMLNHPVSYPKP
ncbi:MAG: SagB/ThcOx family dehydrogenase [Marinilabiliales bacterium]|nr:SagB/ThcOx family dehydrogenase [Marinilabiliales bacterium]